MTDRETLAEVMWRGAHRDNWLDRPWRANWPTDTSKEMYRAMAEAVLARFSVSERGNASPGGSDE